MFLSILSKWKLEIFGVIITGKGEIFRPIFTIYGNCDMIIHIRVKPDHAK